MDFKINKPIYVQIVDFCFRKILRNEWNIEERIPSVRELGATLQVNPNTVMRAFEFMQSENIIFPKRGMGYYIATNARTLILEIKRKEFFEEVLPETFVMMNELEIDLETIKIRYNKYKTEKK